MGRSSARATADPGARTVRALVAVPPRAGELIRLLSGRLAETLLEADDEAPRVFDSNTSQAALRSAVRVVVESEMLFRRMRRLRSREAREFVADWLGDSIQAGLEDFETVKTSCTVLAGVRVRRERLVIGGESRIIAAHHRRWRAVIAHQRSPNARMRALLDMMRLELQWFAARW